MQFSVKISDYQKNMMINMCDAELMGKDIVDEIGRASCRERV